MKRKPLTQPSRRHVSVLRQIVELIPPHLVPKLARQTGATDQARTFSPWSHVVALVYAQLSHALSLNDVCDGLGLHATALHGVRGASVPSRNGFSHANKHRSCALARELFWATLEHVQTRWRGFARGTRSGPAWRFHRSIDIVDSTTIQLVASCLDWAKHRRRKAAAKCHLRLNLASFLPRFAVVDTAREHDCRRAREVCAGLQEGEIVLFDKAYGEFSHLMDLTRRGVFFVTRAKDNFTCRVCERRPRHGNARILKDELVRPTGPRTRQDYPGVLRRVTAVVEVDGQDRTMVFLTNQLTWSARSVCDLYRCRWAIEVFFKQIKQNLQLADFLGNNANAVQWQVWTALLTHLLLRFLAWRSRWQHSFSRACTYVRAALWMAQDLWVLLRRCGTASAENRGLAPPHQAWLPGFARETVGQHP